MNIQVAFLPAEAERLDVSRTVCVILDIFRATTCITTAMANDCQAIYPVVSCEEAYAQAAKIGECLLAGERQSIKLAGFDLGNSPDDFSRDRVAGRKIVMTTSNGTVAIRAAAGAYRTLIASFLNIQAVVREILKSQQDVLLVCAGTERQFSLEDALCAGLLVERITQAAAVELTDAAAAARLMYLQAQDKLVATAGSSRNGSRLYEIGRQADIEYCLQQDSITIVPEYREGVIRR